MDAADPATTLLKDPFIFLNLCRVLSDSAAEAAHHELYTATKDMIVTAHIGDERNTRKSTEGQEQQNVPGACVFHPNKFFFYGGSAMTAFYLSAKQTADPKYMEQIHSIEHTYNAIGIPPTSDIDATWWPDVGSLTDVHGAPLVPTIYSHAIQGLASAYVICMQENLQACVDHIKDNIATLLPGMEGDVGIHITKSMNDRVGVWTINGMLSITINGVVHELKILDVSIHDGANSQFVPGVRHLQEKETNIAYTGNVRILKIQEGGHEYSVPVPFLPHFIQQQMVLIRNYVRTIWSNRNVRGIAREKIRKAYNRILFSSYLLDMYLPMIQPNIVRRNGSHAFSQRALQKAEDHKAMFLHRLGFTEMDIPLIQMIKMIIGYFQTNEEEGVASCVYDSPYDCGVSLDVLNKLCMERKMLNPAHCQRGGTRKRVKKAPQTRRRSGLRHRRR
jgi:hypothetical protein